MIIMKRIIIFAFSAILTAAFITIPVSASTAAIRSGDYNITILENGNAEITETWVLYFGDDQSYSRYYRSYYKTDYYTMTNWAATLDGQDMKRLSAPDDSRPDYSFAIEDTDSENIIHMYHDSFDTERIFTISYTVENAVKVYDDIGDFVWDLTGENDFSSIGVLTASDTIPGGAGLNPEDFRIWAHGPLHGAFVKDGENHASLNIDFVASVEIVDIRVCAPSYLFSGGHRESG
jgi:uncharacterized membrane protein